ncbi:MAG: trypsin-like peptidase domain-containing protein [Coriobacteriia bacterium]|nr:trypsin-like peptidase domain-containing protein [Coriobacteriia bacterium]MCL2746312.1 trypsin-like peptidase domain-containing protein [Coriobacteriia bacterium]MCL2870143.1 trypsin-like peptidase domain-containing protein [Coriobacteriia bacterium]
MKDQDYSQAQGATQHHNSSDVPTADTAQQGQNQPVPQEYYYQQHPQAYQHPPMQVPVAPPMVQPQPPQQHVHFPQPQQPQVHSGAGASKAKSKRNLSIAIVALSLLIVLGGIGVLFGLHGNLFGEVRSPIAATSPGEQSGESSPTAVIELPTDLANPSEDELSVQVAQRVLPSVVSVSGSMAGMGGMGMSGAQSAGAGVILSSEGYIVTNNHVIEHLSNITVTAGAQVYPAVLVGADPSTDLAVLKIDSSGDLPAIELGTSSNLLEGQYVMAVGSPFGHEQSVSAGIISGLGRNNVIATQTTLTAYVDLIQTDAAINPGNSGGALVDKAGRLIGINSLINTLSGASAGVGFAIPVDTVVNVSNQLIESGHASHAFLGVGTQTITPEIAQAYGLPVERGAVVNTVAGGSPADRAGIQVGDFIIRIGDREVNNSEDVFSAIRSNRVGDRIEVEIYRSGENDVVEATLASDDFLNRPQQEQQQQQSPNLPPDHPPTGP